ncbi:GntR family transcriptional regulator [Thermogemmatispora carboxidivorans]|uniref:GntR family transcriptional regulator n=1 Tax=Thermogemmatispora carboxidivorans TaxID=1382306 RepID=UPI00069C422D|nr:GntR family transcriptional regulator [Thermogemmatispora carboxidivorans]
MNIRTPILGRRVLREDIKEFLIDAIVKGQYRPGERIVESRVAQELGVSQGPVREALRDLELLGFVVSSPYRGTQVRKVSRRDLLELYPIRAALEGVAARAAAMRIDKATLRQLEELLAEMRDAAVRNELHAQTAANIAFHRLIVQAAGNRLLLQYWDSMQLYTTTFVTVAIAQRTPQELAERHQVIIEALRDRDPERAEQVMRRHIEEAGEWLRAAPSSEEQAGEE